MSLIKISIITATLNCKNVLEDLIKTVIPQVTNEVEFIIIDGGSTDGTVEIIKKYSKFLHYWTSSPDNGIYDALNKGIIHARGEYVSFVGADDILLNNYSNIYLNAIKKNPEGNFFSSKGLLNKKEVGKEFKVRDLDKGMIAVHSGSLMKKELLTENGGFNTKYKIASDYEFLVKNRLSLKITFLDVVTIIIGHNGLSSSYYILTFKEVYLIQKKYRLNNTLINIIIFLKSLLKKKINMILRNA